MAAVACLPVVADRPAEAKIRRPTCLQEAGPSPQSRLAGRGAKQRKARKLAENVTDIDENHTYGNYDYPDPVMEVEDSNNYYSSTVYEADTSRTTDNNSQYEN